MQWLSSLVMDGFDVRITRDSSAVIVDLSRPYSATGQGNDIKTWHARFYYYSSLNTHVMECLYTDATERFRVEAV